MSRAFPRRWRLVSSTACSAIALVVAGCGGGEGAGDQVPPGVGSILVEQTQEVEDALAAKDFATAREQALDLQERVTAAIDAGRVPSSLQDELLAAVKDLVRLIPEEAPEPEEDKEEDEDDKGKGKG
ncbi:MAG: hypothetical protein M3377_10345, partial [Actinomycetota bacterium]|nr:hypothetical protein [Actinomycetota bacterium]